MKSILISVTLAVFALAVCAAPKNGDNTLSKKEQKRGWVLLFDGKTSANWRSIHSSEFPKTAWSIADGMISIADHNNKTTAGDIITVKKYKNYEFSVDFKFAPGANSGIKYFVTEDAKGNVSNVSCEYQILDDAKHPDAKLGIDGNRRLAALYDMMPCVKSPAAANVWHNARIVVRDNNVEHWLNGKLVLKYQRGSQNWKDHYAKSKFTKKTDFGMAKEGYILLQDHGGAVSYKNIKIREL